MALRRQPCRVREVVVAAVAAVEREAQRRHVSIDHDASEVMAEVDADYLRVALINLLSNAIRHASSRVAIALGVLVEKNAILISVSDDGAGVLPGDAERIFEPWYQAAGASEHGLGLGLSIVRRIVEWHGGDVTLATKSGIGATFRVMLPITDNDVTAVRRAATS
jgi:signal transduction histidine kinase